MDNEKDISVEKISEDIHMMKLLAEQGNASAIAGGKMFIIWGVVISGYIILSWVSTHLFPSWGNGGQNSILTIVGVMIFALFIGFILSRKRKQPAESTINWRSKIIQMTWVATTLAIISFLMGFELSATTAIDGSIINVVIALLVGVAMMVTASVANKPIIYIAALGWMALGFASFFIKDDAIIALLYLSVCILFMIVPGFLLLRDHEKNSL